jgi:hypothetical protein
VLGSHRGETLGWTVAHLRLPAFPRGARIFNWPDRDSWWYAPEI